MPACTKKHFVKQGDSIPVQVPCYYIAGVCITNPIHEGGLTQFLRATYPYHHHRTYAGSKMAHETIVPYNLIVANLNM